MLRGLLRSESRLLIVGAGTGAELLLEAWKHQQNLAGLKWEQVENDMKEQLQGILFW